MNNKASITALMSSFGRAFHAENEEHPVFTDYLAKELLRRLVNVHIAPSPLCRGAYTEQALENAVSAGTKQYVILGAGLDTFAFREKVQGV